MHVGAHRTNIGSLASGFRLSACGQNRGGRCLRSRCSRLCPRRPSFSWVHSRIGLEFFQTAPAAEEIPLPFSLAYKLRRGRVDFHAADPVASELIARVCLSARHPECDQRCCGWFAQIRFRRGLKSFETMPATEVILLTGIRVDVLGTGRIYIHSADRIILQRGRRTGSVCGAASILVHRRMTLSCSIAYALYWIHPAGRAGTSRSSYRRASTP